ncbi:MAG: alcohol dehydrogenase catalytic domain-containing protein [Pseudomonadota bacterium]|nr:alcohol dehydrogenase catalytic domain-containing protein [Pseudomonadota bacterium]
MKAAMFAGSGAPLRLAEMQRPKAQPGGLVIKVGACGICASDLHAAEAGMVAEGNVFGHEYAGEVVEVGPGAEAGWQVGDRLVAIPASPCGACAACREGTYMQCEGLILQGFDPRLPGAYAQYASCVGALSMKIPASLADRDAALIEPMAVGLGAFKAANVPAGASVLVIGAGVIGLSVAKWARFFGAGDVGISEKVPARRERAQRAGHDLVIDAAAHANPVAEYQRLTGRVPSVIFECVGRPLMQALIDMAPAGAQIVMVGTGMQPEQVTVVTAALKRLRMTFTLGYEFADFAFILRMLAAGRIGTEGLVTATVGLDELPAMFETLQKPNDHCKVLVTP